MYFRNKGLHTDLIKNVFKFINKNQNILISEISNIGKSCHVYDIFVKIFRNNGFYMDISNENEDFNIDVYLEHLSINNYIKIRKIG